MAYRTFDLHCGVQDLFRCSLWDLVPRLGIECNPLALGVQSFSHWTTSEVPEATLLESRTIKDL